MSAKWLCFLLLPFIASAQDKPSIRRVTLLTDANSISTRVWQVEVVLSNVPNPTALEFLVQNERGEFLSPRMPDSARFDPARPPQLNCCSTVDTDVITINMAPLRAGTTAKVIRVILRDVPGAETGSLGSEVNVKNPKPLQGELQPVGEAKTRDASDIYIAAEGLRVGGSDDTKSENDGIDRHYATVDLKFSRKLFQEPWFLYSKKGSYWLPAFDMKASTVKGADPSALSFGLSYVMPFAQVHLSPGGKLEFSKDFTQSSAVSDTRLRFFLPSFIRQKVGTDVFVGLEAGRNIDAVLAEAKGNAIARPLFGGQMYVHGTKLLGAKTVVFNGTYTRRQPLTKEVVVDTDKDKRPFVRSFNKAGREYAEAKLEATYTDQFGWFVGYEYGQLPPAYKIVDHRVKFGFLFKATLKRQ